MALIIKHNYIGRSIVALSLLFISVAVNAQDEDSVRILSQDLENITDSVLQEPPPDTAIVPEAYQDEPSVTASVHFLRKQLQSNGGGPDSIQYRKLPDSTVKNLKSDGDFWYVDYPFEKKKQDEDKEQDIPFVQTKLFQTILWMIIIGAFVAVIIMYLSGSNIGLFRKASKPIVDGGTGYAETDNIFEINYQQEIDKAISNGNYRLAVRLMFLRLLKNMSDKKIITYKQDRTNFDYLMQLHPTSYYTDFFRLTRFYEYSWYGQFDIEPERFTIIKNDFENFDRNLK